MRPQFNQAFARPQYSLSDIKGSGFPVLEGTATLMGALLIYRAAKYVNDTGLATLAQKVTENAVKYISIIALVAVTAASARGFAGNGIVDPIMVQVFTCARLAIEYGSLYFLAIEARKTIQAQD